MRKRRHERGEELSVHSAPIDMSRLPVVLLGGALCLWPVLRWLLPPDAPGLVVLGLLAFLVLAWVVPAYLFAQTRFVSLTTIGLVVAKGARSKVVAWDQIRAIEEVEDGLMVWTDNASMVLWRDLRRWEQLVAQVRQALQAGSGAALLAPRVDLASTRPVLGDRVLWYTPRITGSPFVQGSAAVVVVSVLLLPFHTVLGSLGHTLLAATVALAYVLHRLLAMPTMSQSRLGLSADWLATPMGGRRENREAKLPWSDVAALHDHPSGWRLETTRGDYLIHRRGRNAAEAADAIRKVLALRDQGLPLPRMDMTPAGAISRVDVSAERGLMRAEEEDGETKG